eukprot:GILJ01003866.1.p1 GENE.GILJ01003866.1~~GILJ01003866.1.p1  ORF type:complete len:1310 (-),score=238.99 GILJ01003866.1:288-4217(-)
MTVTNAKSDGASAAPLGNGIEMIQVDKKQLETIAIDGESELKAVPPSAAATETPAEKKEETPMVPFKELFRFADRRDKIYMIVGSICAICNGTALPLFSLVFGAMVDALNADPGTIYTEISKYASYFVYIGIGAFVLSFGETGLWMAAGERQVCRMRERYLRAILRQNIAWFDVNNPGELPTRIAGDCLKVQGAIGEKVSSYMHHTATFVTGFIVGFTKGWQLTLVMLGVTPLLGICGAFMGKTMQGIASRGQTAYAKAGSVADEVLSSMRTVASLSGEDREVTRYASKLEEAAQVGVLQGRVTGLGMGLTMFLLFGSYALAFWFGSIMITDHVYNPVSGRNWTGGDILAVFFAVLMGSFSLGQTAPLVKAFNEGRGAGFKMLQVLNRVPPIDSSSDEGQTLPNLLGRIELKDVQFTYPSRTHTQVLRGLSLTIEPSRTVALVGHSGCGKSTVIQLLERFYDPDAGVVMVDGVDLRTLNLKWWRSKVSLVGQEPVLFGASIAANIAYGKSDATREQIEAAAKFANAHSFISKLPQGYETHVGERGGQLSGGQKQRIAIARAIVKDPALLLLDEATSALDNKSESIVQHALDNIMTNRTTLVVAHRLSTIRNADKIVVLDKGVKVEEGTHDMLFALNGHYTGLVRLQQQQQQEEEKTRRSSTVGGEGDAAEEEVDDENVGAKFEEAARQRAASENLPVASAASASNMFTDEEAKKKAKELLEKKKMEELKREKMPLARVLSYVKGDGGWLLVAVIAAVVNGAIFPMYSIVLSEMLSVFYLPEDRIRPEANFMALMFLVLAAGAGLANYFQISTFTLIGERITRRLREQSFKSMVRQDIGWFDDEANATGALTTKLSTETSLVQGITGTTFGTSVQALGGMGLGLGIAFWYSWSLSLVCLACVPIIAISGAVQMAFIKGFAEQGDKQYEQAGKVAGEAVTNARTVAAFGNEDKVLELYSEKMVLPTRTGIKRARVSGFFFGLSQFCLFGVYGLTFWYGGKLVSEGDLSFRDMFRCLMAVILSATGVGQATSFAPDMSKAKAAAITIFRLMDQVPPIDYTSTAGDKPVFTAGEVEFKDVQFRYPSRPDTMVLKSMTFRAKAREILALVGHSGCGKSTVVQLLERFYDPEAGSILIDGHDIKTVNVTWLRKHIGMVGQEPVLFETSIYENIRYGNPEATREEIEGAAQLANASDFIYGLEKGFETNVGPRGSQLSGGQKQRVAIARAIVRNPKILLLDEATSALDAESERVVQKALDRVMVDRTTIVIAHRLSTIENAHCIAVVHEGRIIEQGSHHTLLALNGAYRELVGKKH